MICNCGHSHEQHRIAQLVLPFHLLIIGFLILNAVAHAAAPKMRAAIDQAIGRVDLSESGQLILTYNYHRVDVPEGLLEKIHPNNRKYAQPRSDYIHPLCGIDGEVLTEDWSHDHPHHRGIYWAWPEVDYRGERGDLHALQRVFARPTGKLELTQNDKFAEVKAENLWMWKDESPIVRELSVIRSYAVEGGGRLIDLNFSFTAIQDDVTIARREKNLYGGMNFRMSLVRNTVIVKHTDPQHATPRRAWADLVGTPSNGTKVVGIAMFQKQSNTQYPGAWIDYPELPWLQPTFPSAGTRYILKKEKPLVLQYRLWIHQGGKLSDADYVDCWRDFQTDNNPTNLGVSFSDASLQDY